MRSYPRPGSMGLGACLSRDARGRGEPWNEYAGRDSFLNRNMRSKTGLWGGSEKSILVAPLRLLRVLERGFPTWNEMETV